MSQEHGTREVGKGNDNAGSCHLRELLWTQLGHAVTLIAKQDQIVWTIFGLFWAADAVLVVALFPNGVLPGGTVCMTVSWLGFVLSALWAVLHFRVVAHPTFYEGMHQHFESELKIPEAFALSGWRNQERFRAAMGRTRRARPFMAACPIVWTVLWGLALLRFWGGS